MIEEPTIKVDTVSVTSPQGAPDPQERDRRWAEGVEARRARARKIEGPGGEWLRGGNYGGISGC